MIQITRKIGESFMIGDDITVTFLGLKNNLRGEKTTNVNLGIIAPNNIAIHRDDICKKIKNLKEKI